jgi:hypothetical protein
MAATRAVAAPCDVAIAASAAPTRPDAAFAGLGVAAAG